MVVDMKPYVFSIGCIYETTCDKVYNKQQDQTLCVCVLDISLAFQALYTLNWESKGSVRIETL